MATKNKKWEDLFFTENFSDPKDQMIWKFQQGLH